MEAANAKQIEAQQQMANLVAEQTAENAKAVNQSNSGFQTPMSGPNRDQDAKQTILFVFRSVLSMQSMECHSVSEQLMAAGATHEDVKKINQIMAQPVRQRETGSALPGSRLEEHSFACDVVVVSDEEFSTGECVPGFNKLDIQGQEAIKRSLTNAITEKRRLAQKCKQEGDGACNLFCSWFWIQSIAVPFYLTLSRIGEADNPVLFAQRRSCLAPVSMQLASGPKILPARAK